PALGGAWVTIIENPKLLTGNVFLQNHRVRRVRQIFSQLLGGPNDADTRAALPRIRFQHDGEMQAVFSHEFFRGSNPLSDLVPSKKSKSRQPRTGGLQMPEDLVLGFADKSARRNRGIRGCE